MSKADICAGGGGGSPRKRGAVRAEKQPVQPPCTARYVSVEPQPCKPRCGARLDAPRQPGFGALGKERCRDRMREHEKASEFIRQTGPLGKCEMFY